MGLHGQSIRGRLLAVLVDCRGHFLAGFAGRLHGRQCWPGLVDCRTDCPGFFGRFGPISGPGQWIGPGLNAAHAGRVAIGAGVGWLHAGRGKCTGFCSTFAGGKM